MANEIMIPALPCASINPTLEFYVAMGFEITYQQARPNNYGVVKRDNIEFHFFTMKGYEPANSYTTCLILVPDIASLHKAFADGLRAHYGKVPISGIPRITKPNNKNAHGDTRFIVVDPGGNWLRFIQKSSGKSAPDYGESQETKIAQALHTAGILAESKGDYAAAAKLLDSALAREANPTSSERVQVLVARAWVAATVDDNPLATTILADVRNITLSDDERAALADELERADELEQLLKEGS